MEAPKCRLCQERHWGGCKPAPVTKAIAKVNDHSAGVKKMVAHPPDAEVGIPATLPLKPKARTKPKTVAVPPLPKRKKAPNGTFNKAAYFRAYMRKRRAALKQGGQNVKDAK